MEITSSRASTVSVGYVPFGWKVRETDKGLKCVRSDHVSISSCVTVFSGFIGEIRIRVSTSIGGGRIQTHRFVFVRGLERVLYSSVFAHPQIHLIGQYDGDNQNWSAIRCSISDDEPSGAVQNAGHRLDMGTLSSWSLSRRPYILEVGNAPKRALEYQVSSRQVRSHDKNGDINQQASLNMHLIQCISHLDHATSGISFPVTMDTPFRLPGGLRMDILSTSPSKVQLKTGLGSSRLAIPLAGRSCVLTSTPTSSSTSMLQSSI